MGLISGTRIKKICDNELIFHCMAISLLYPLRTRNPGGGGGGSLIFAYILRLGSFFGVQNFEYSQPSL